MSVFGDAYAGAYDALYRDKDYGGECDMVEALLAEFGTIAPVRRILDLGCGTGNHALPLAARGYHVTGVDRSDAMLAQAREKAAAAGLAAATEFRVGDVCHLRLDAARFDAALMMFAVLGYLGADDDVRAALTAVRAHLRCGAVFVFDVWHGLGVLADRPGPRKRVVPTASGRIERHTTSLLDEARRLCTVEFNLQRWEGETLVESTREDHVMRFFFADEIERFAADCGFACAALRRFPEWREPVSADSWNIVVALRAV